MTIRDLDEEFLNAMRAKLYQGRRDGYVGYDCYWKKTVFPRKNIRGATGYLMDRLQHEVLELAEAITIGTREQIKNEAADVANFAMFIADINSIDFEDAEDGQ